MMSASEIAEKLAGHIDALVRKLLPGAYKAGAFWYVGSLDGEKGDSLYIHRSGLKAGRWVDAATGEFGDALDLVNGVSYGSRDMRAAMQWAAAWLGDASLSAVPREQHDGDKSAIGAARNLWRTAQVSTPDQRCIGWPE